MTDWSATLPAFLDQVWQRLGRGVADARAPARYPVLATVGPDGGAEARTVGLRGADRAAATAEVHTDAATPKVSELARQPRATLLIWEPRPQLQVRLKGPVDVLTGTVADARWARVPEASRGNYGVEPVPGEAIPAVDAYVRVPDRARFAVLKMRIETIEALHLARDFHRRAVFERADGWTGRWIAP